MRNIIPWILVLGMVAYLWYSSINQPEPEDRTEVYQDRIDSLRDVVSEYEVMIDTLEYKLIESREAEDSIKIQTSKLRAEYENKINNLRHLDPTEHLQLFTNYTDSIEWFGHAGSGSN